MDKHVWAHIHTIVRNRFLIGGLGVLTVGLVGWIGAGLWVKRGVHEPAFTVLSEEADVQVRQYEPTIVAVTEVEGERDAALSEGFRRLAGYIFGKNKSKASISMTAPVSARPSEKIAMTAPVSASSMEAGSFRVTFAMPAEYSLLSLPEPDDDRVRLEVEPARRVAVVRFRGWANSAVIETQTARLLDWVESSGEEIVGAPVLAQYDPPFTMPLMRRNEMMVTLR